MIAQARAIWSAVGGWRSLAAFALGAVVFFGLGQCSGEARQKKIEKAAHAVAVAEQVTRNAEATGKATAEAYRDAQEVANLERSLTDAVAQVADSAPTPSDISLACGRLRSQGADLSKLPACRGFAAGSQADPRPVSPH